MNVRVPLLLLLTACGGLSSLDEDDLRPPDDDPAGDTDAPPTSDDTDPPDDTAPPPPDDSDPPAPPVDSAEVDSDPPAPAPWSAAIAVDGAWDCPAGATFSTSTPAVSGTPATCITWDADALYVAWRHPDVATGGPSHFFWLYAGPGGAGTTQGVLYNTQRPSLPGPVSHHLRRKADGSFDSLMTWTGGAWSDSAAGWLSAGGRQVAEAGQVLELRIPRADLTLATIARIAAGVLFEGAGSETTYAVTPASATADGYDPDLLQAWEFDLSSPAAPNSYAPRP